MKKVVICCVSLIFMIMSILDVVSVHAIDANDYPIVLNPDSSHPVYAYDNYTYDFMKNYDVSEHFNSSVQEEVYNYFMQAYYNDVQNVNGFDGAEIFDENDYPLRIFYVPSENVFDVEYADNAPVYCKVDENNNFNYYSSYTRYVKFKLVSNGIDFSSGGFLGETDITIDTVNSTNSVIIPFFKANALTFEVNPMLENNLDLNVLAPTFTITAHNESNNYYDYMVYISENPSSIGVINSFNSSKYFMSSKQWCYQWLQDYSALNGSIDDYIADNIADGIKGADILDFTFGNGMYNSLFNAWGGAFDGMKEYFSVDDETMSFYQVSQTNCPVYRINPGDTKTHTISYSSLNLELGKTYYLNIIYTPADFTVYSAMTTPIVDAGTGQQGNYPVFDTRNIAKYSVYDSYEFSVSNGVFSQDANTLYSYSDLIKYTNPSNSVAKIESDDDEIIVSDNDSYDNSVSTEYINYGQIYHGCTFYNGTSGSGGSGGLVEENIELKIYGVDDLDFELTQLSEPVSKFQQFMQVIFGFLPPEMLSLFALGISTCIICRIVGR